VRDPPSSRTSARQVREDIWGRGVVLPGFVEVGRIKFNACSFSIRFAVCKKQITAFGVGFPAHFEHCRLDRSADIPVRACKRMGIAVIHLNHRAFGA